MALNRHTFQTRAMTAVLFAVIMLAGLLWNQWSFLVLFSIIHFGCWIEYQKLVALIDPGYKNINPFHKYGIMIAGYGLMLFFTHDWYITDTVSLHSIGMILALICLFLIPISELLFSKQFVVKNIAHSFFGLMYISLSWALMLHIRSSPLWMAKNGQQSIEHFFALMEAVTAYLIPLIIVCSIWINDTMAYLVGSLIGKTPLSSISPKKTWEGTIGGMILAITAAAVIAWSFDLEMFKVVGIASIASIAGAFGDLLESKLKRLAGVKDSGHFMPGHGGFLDRFDSLLLAIPFVWLFLKLIE